jgi:hypothetical protein
MTLYKPTASTNAATERTSWPLARRGAYAQKRNLVQHVGVRGHRLLRVGKGLQGGSDVGEVGGTTGGVVLGREERFKLTPWTCEKVVRPSLNNPLDGSARFEMRHCETQYAGLQQKQA